VRGLISPVFSCFSKSVLSPRHASAMPTPISTRPITNMIVSPPSASSRLAEKSPPLLLPDPVAIRTAVTARKMLIRLLAMDSTRLTVRFLSSLSSRRPQMPSPRRQSP
jgi:hypothetical protein